MKFKSIEPGMVIHCKTVEEKNMLYDELCRIGNMTTGNDKRSNFLEANTYGIKNLKNETWEFSYKKPTHEFSDLIIPEEELSAVEVPKIMRELEFDYVKDFLGIENYGRTLDEMLNIDATPEQVVEICQKWKADHEKKAPEVEWVWKGFIFEITSDGEYHLLGEYDLSGYEYEESAQEFMEEELKEYVLTQEGNYIAVVRHICRVKAVE